MNYVEKLESIKTVRELFDFREELMAEKKKHSDLWYQEGTPARSENLDNCQEASYFIGQVEFQIEHFKEKGLLLTSIEFPIKEKPERTFTQTEIEHLQNAVHKITGDGEVMGLFNQLLGIGAGSGALTA